MTNAPNLESVPNVEMTNAFVNNARNANNLARNEAVRRSRAEAVLAKEELKAKKAKEAANKANAIARKAAVERSKAEAAAAKAEARAKREDSSGSNAARKAANNAARKAKEAANKANVNARNAAANAKKLAANAIVKNVENKLKVIKNGTGSKENKFKKGRKIYRIATPKLHPNRGGNTESFVKLGKAFYNFQKEIGTRDDSELTDFNETWTA